MEIFKPIPGYTDYQVSNIARVKSNQRVVVGKTGRKYNVKERILRQSISNGYYIVPLTKEFIKKNKLVHQLVAMAFLGHKPNGFKIVVDHIDNDKLNNNAENLQLVTNRDNTSKKNGGSSRYIGVDRNGNKWRARIRTLEKQEHLGYFDSEIDAHNAYQDRLSSLIAV